MGLLVWLFVCLISGLRLYLYHVFFFWKAVISEVNQSTHTMHASACVNISLVKQVTVSDLESGQQELYVLWNHSQWSFPWHVALLSTFDLLCYNFFLFISMCKMYKRVSLWYLQCAQNVLWSNPPHVYYSFLIPICFQSLPFTVWHIHQRGQSRGWRN
jgi:hypothetical protein